jgi:hypothetical protein
LRSPVTSTEVTKHNRATCFGPPAEANVIEMLVRRRPPGSAVARLKPTAAAVRKVDRGEPISMHLAHF